MKPHHQMTLTDQCIAKLKKIGPLGDLKLPRNQCSQSIVTAFYRAAKKLGIKIMFRNSPDGMHLWRLR